MRKLTFRIETAGAAKCLKHTPVNDYISGPDMLGPTACACMSLHIYSIFQNTSVIGSYNLINRILVEWNLIWCLYLMTGARLQTRLWDYYAQVNSGSRYRPWFLVLGQW